MTALEMAKLKFAPTNRLAERAAASDSFFNALLRLRTLRVGDVMSKQVVEVAADQSLAEIARVFVAHAISAAPVVDRDGGCVGVLSASDFLKRDAQLESATLESQPAAHPDEPQSDVANRFMTPAVQSIAAEEPLLQAAKIMCAQHVHRLFVLDRMGRPIGVISTMDIVAALLHVIEEMDLHEL